MTAVSGTNVAIVTGAILLLLRAMTVGPRVSALVAGTAMKTTVDGMAAVESSRILRVVASVPP